MFFLLRQISDDEITEFTQQLRPSLYLKIIQVMNFKTQLQPCRKIIH